MTDTKPKRVALYARVSTKDKGQDVENQLAQLREFCERQGYEIHDEYMDDESGTKGKRERSGFARMPLTKHYGWQCRSGDGNEDHRQVTNQPP